MGISSEPLKILLFENSDLTNWGQRVRFELMENSLPVIGADDPKNQTRAF